MNHLTQSQAQQHKQKQQQQPQLVSAFYHTHSSKSGRVFCSARAKKVGRGRGTVLINLSCNKIESFSVCHYNVVSLTEIIMICERCLANRRRLHVDEDCRVKMWKRDWKRVTYCASCSNMVDAFITSRLTTGPIRMAEYCRKREGELLH